MWDIQRHRYVIVKHASEKCEQDLENMLEPRTHASQDGVSGTGSDT